MSKLRGAIIGFGNIAEKGHWPTYASTADAEMVAIMDPSAARQQIARRLRPGLRMYSNLKDLYRTETLDFVDICTPPASHATLALQALENHCHVLCEKPLSLKRSDYEALANAMASHERTVFTVHNWKYAPIFQKAFSLIRDGHIGPVWHVDIFTLRSSHCKGAAHGIPSPQLSPEKGEGLPEDWRKDPTVAGGGILIDHGWHSFYLLTNLIGADPQRLLAKMLRSPDDPQSLEEAVQALVQFPSADGYIHLTWRSPIRRNSVIIQGQKGTLLLDDDRLFLTTHAGEKQELTFDRPLSAGSHHAEWFTALWPDFVEEIRTPSRRGRNFREAGWCLALTTAAYESNRRSSQEIEIAFPRSPTAASAVV